MGIVSNIRFTSTEQNSTYWSALGKIWYLESTIVSWFIFSASVWRHARDICCVGCPHARAVRKPTSGHCKLPLEQSKKDPTPEVVWGHSCFPVSLANFESDHLYSSTTRPVSRDIVQGRQKHIFLTAKQRREKFLPSPTKWWPATSLHNTVWEGGWDKTTAAGKNFLQSMLSHPLEKPTREHEGSFSTLLKGVVGYMPLHVEKKIE